MELCLAKEICLIECTVWAAFNLGLDAKYFSECCPVIFSVFLFVSVCYLNLAWTTKLVISLWELLFCSFTVVSECLKNVNVLLAFLRRWYLHFIKQKWRLVVETWVWKCLLIWGLNSMTRFLGLMHFTGSRHIPFCWFQWVLRSTAIWVSGFEMKTEGIRNTRLVTSWVKI